MLIRHVMIISYTSIYTALYIAAACNVFGCRLLQHVVFSYIVVDAMMMFEHRVSVLTHDLKHQCRIGDVSHCTTPVDRHSKMASSTGAEAPYLRGKTSNIYCMRVAQTIDWRFNRHEQEVFRLLPIKRSDWHWRIRFSLWRNMQSKRPAGGFIQVLNNG